MSDDNRQIVRKSKLAGDGKERDPSNTTVEERFHLVWQLTIEEWAKKGIDITKLPMQKDVVRLIRLKDK